LRYLLSSQITYAMNTLYPVGTLTVNFIGSFLIGLSYEIFEQTIISPEIRVFFATGFLGGFTTFSNFALENANLLRGTEYQNLALNLVVQNGGGLILALTGIFCARFILKFI